MAEQRMWSRPSDRDKGKEEMDFRAPVAPARAKTKAVLLVEDDDDDDYGRAPRSSAAHRQDRNEPYVVAKGARPIPWRVQEAAALIVDYRATTPLSERARQELTLHFLQHPHEFYTKDPFVTLWATVDTGTARIYCKDCVPISLHLLALAFGATFQLQVTAKARTTAQPWAEGVQIRPCRSGEQGGRAQPLGTAAAVMAALERADQDPSVVEARTQRYMDALGTLDTRDVCDPDWIEEQTKGLRAAILSNKDDADQDGLAAKLARQRGTTHL